MHTLRSRQIKTLTELRRIEKLFAHFGEPQFCEPMTTAWVQYVDSHNLLSELRGLTHNYPFSSELLDEAKTMVIKDPASQRSWNYCWLVLSKIQAECAFPYLSVEHRPNRPSCQETHREARQHASSQACHVGGQAAQPSERSQSRRGLCD